MCLLAHSAARVEEEGVIEGREGIRKVLVSADRIDETCIVLVYL